MTIKQLSKPGLLAFSAAALLALGGCSNENSDASLRVIHASPDAPAVNLKLDNINRITDLDYAESSGFISIPSGVQDIDVEAIIPGGNADVISIDNFTFAEASRNTIIALNNTADIEALVVDESASLPASTEIAVAVVHASPDAPAVDVYVTQPGAIIDSINASFSFDFGEQVDAGAIPATSYQIRVTPAGTKNVVFDSGPVDLSGFAGQKLVLAAISTTNSTSQAASDIKLLAVTDSASLVLLDEATNTGARVVHASPDADLVAAGPVEVFATSSALTISPTELIPAFSYTDIVPGADSFVGVPAGDYEFAVAVDGDGIGAAVYTSPVLGLAQGTEYTVIAAGYVGTTPAFELLATEDNNRSVVTQASVKVIHAAPVAGPVDVFVTAAGDFSASDVENGLAGAPLLDDFEFGAITDYVAVAPGDYDIRVVAGGSAAINVENFNLAAGSVSTLIARQPNATGTPNDFNVIVLTN
jgi:hypothetical protein